MKLPTRTLRIVAASLLLLLTLLAVVGMIFLGQGVRAAGRTGTFNLFGYSFHLNKSTEMSPDIQKDELVAVRHTPFSQLKEGDLIAFYLQEEGEELLLIRRLQSAQGLRFTVSDNSGTPLEITADTCRILGKATSKSAALGKAVVFLQTDDGRTIFLGWTIGVASFLLGMTILIHLLWKMIFGKPSSPSAPGPVDELTGLPLSFDAPVTIQSSDD